MLVLARKRKESVCIRQEGKDDIWITVKNIDGGIVRLGILAPDDVVCMREEISGARLPPPPEKDLNNEKPAPVRRKTLPTSEDSTTKGKRKIQGRR